MPPSNNTEKDWMLQEPWVSISGILFDIRAGKMHDKEALEEIRGYFSSLIEERMGEIDQIMSEVRVEKNNTKEGLPYWHALVGHITGLDDAKTILQKDLITNKEV